MKILVVYDGTLQAKKALGYGIEKLRGTGGELVLLQVFDPSMFVDYDAGPRAADMMRAEMSGHLAWAKRHLEEKAAGLKTGIITDEGDTVGKAVHHADALHIDLLLTPPRFRAIRKKAACSVRLIPGPILVPVDSAGSPAAGLDAILHEAALSSSPVLLLGIVPVHLYSREEKKELALVMERTAAALKRTKEVLAERGAEVRDLMRSGYPDEEILKAAEENAVSLIMLPSGGTTPSELNKAAAVLMDDMPHHHWTLSLFPAEAGS